MTDGNNDDGVSWGLMGCLYLTGIFVPGFKLAQESHHPADEPCLELPVQEHQ